MTQIMCGYIPKHLHSVTARTIQQYAPTTEFVNMEGSVYNYWQAVTDRWNAFDTLITLEQDMEIDENTIASLEKCPEYWCTFAYDVYDTKLTYFSLGCAKFSAAAQGLITIPRVAYSMLDVWILHEFQKVGIMPHVHGKIPHHHDYSDVDPTVLESHRKSCDNLKKRLDAGGSMFIDPVDKHCDYTSPSAYEIEADTAPTEVLIRDEDGSWIKYEPDKHDALMPYLNQLRADENEGHEV